MTGLSFWATGYCVSTVGLDEETIRIRLDVINLDKMPEALKRNKKQKAQAAVESAWEKLRTLSSSN